MAQRGAALSAELFSWLIHQRGVLTISFSLRSTSSLFSICTAWLCVSPILRQRDQFKTPHPPYIYSQSLVRCSIHQYSIINHRNNGTSSLTSHVFLINCILSPVFCIPNISTLGIKTPRQGHSFETHNYYYNIRISISSHSLAFR